MKRNKNKVIFGAGTVGASAAVAAIIATIIANRNKRRNSNKASKSQEKKAGLWGDLVVGPAARTFVDEIDLADKAFRASSKDDYKAVNDKARDTLEKRIADLSNAYDLDKGTLGNLTASFSSPFYIPGDRIIMNSSSASNAKGMVAAHAHGRPVNTQRIHGIDPDHRLVPLTMLASGMLEGGYRRRFSEDPSIANMAYAIPFVAGQYAMDTGMTKDDIRNASTNGLDKVFMDAVKQQARKYPAWRNLVSAYVNGGAGDVSDPNGFGIQRPFWDYAARAPTQEGTNMLRKVVSDIGRAGGYGGVRPGMRKDENGDYSILNIIAPYEKYDQRKADKHYKELLRFFDNIGPSVFMPKTILGKDMLFHDVGGIIPNAEKTWNSYVPYYKADPELLSNINMALGGGAIGKTLNDLTSKANSIKSE